MNNITYCRWSNIKIKSFCAASIDNFKAQILIIKDDNDGLLTEPTKKVEQFQLHYEGLLNNDSTNGNFDKHEKLIYRTA